MPQVNSGAVVDRLRAALDAQARSQEAARKAAADAAAAKQPVEPKR